MSQQLETLAQDLRFGFRQLRRNPSFALIAILCLTLGIGANAAVFSWIEGILLRPFPLVKNQDRLMALAGTDRAVQKKGTGSGFTDLSWPDFLDLRRNCTQVEFITDKIMGTTLSIADRAEHVTGSSVSSNYFDALGIHPTLGRGFGLAFLVMTLVALAASFLPASRAVRIDPVRALRE
jgi:putative ABC transport system permease protein